MFDLLVVSEVMSFELTVNPSGLTAAIAATAEINKSLFMTFCGYPAGGFLND